jgi:hypothetical protein
MALNVGDERVRHPIISLCWDLAHRVRRLERDNKGWQDACARLTHDIAATDRSAEAWRARALSLYLIADPNLRVDVMRAHTDIDMLTEDR